jgi:hypothetical protein
MNPNELKFALDSMLAVFDSIPDNDTAANSLFNAMMSEVGPITITDINPERVEVVRSVLKALKNPRTAPCLALVVEKFVLRLDTAALEFANKQAPVVPVDAAVAVPVVAFVDASTPAVAEPIDAKTESTP